MPYPQPMDLLAYSLNPAGVAFLVFGVVAIGAIIYWSVTGSREEKRQQKNSQHHDHDQGQGSSGR